MHINDGVKKKLNKKNIKKPDIIWINFNNLFSE
jgi:hypothetical protein